MSLTVRQVSRKEPPVRPRIALIAAILSYTLSGAVSAGAEAPPAGEAVQGSTLEQIETQDPGYLKLAARILDRSTYEALTFDPRLGEPAKISFRLTRPAEIRVRIFRKDQNDLLLRTLSDWTPFKLGRNELFWDGRDASENITENSMVHFVFEGRNPQHLRHSRDRCHDLKVGFLSERREDRSAGDASTVIATIVGDRAYGSDSGYVVSTFLDWRPWFRKEYPKEAGEFELPAMEDLAQGEHILTVNISDRNDHVGSATLSFTAP